MSGITIKNPSNGIQARVTNDNQLLVQSENLSLQHFISRYRGQMYQTEYFDTGITNKTNVVAFVKNTSPTLSLVLAYIRLQVPVVAGGTALGANAANYFSVGFGEEYVSGGTAKTSVNLNRSSGNQADSLNYDSDPTLTGTFLEIDRLYLNSTDQFSYRKEGSIILGANDTMSVKFTTDNTSGTAYCRLSYMLMDLNN